MGINWETLLEQMLYISAVAVSPLRRARRGFILQKEYSPVIGLLLLSLFTLAMHGTFGLT